MTRINASIFTLEEKDTAAHPRQTWQRLAEELSSGFRNQYGFNQGVPFRIIFKENAVYSPDKKLVHLKSVDMNIRRKDGLPTLLDLVAGNIFSDGTATQINPVATHSFPHLAQWIRARSQISLTEHHKLIYKFIKDATTLGWSIDKSKIRPGMLPTAEVRNKERVFSLRPNILKEVLKTPFLQPDRQIALNVVNNDIRVAKNATNRMRQIIPKLLPNSDWPNAVTESRSLVANAMNLFVLGDQLDLMQDDTSRDLLRASEAQGLLFKLTKAKTLSNDYAAMNVIYDLFITAGGRAWEPKRPLMPFTSLDAGHDKSTKRSRWTRVDASPHGSLALINIHETELAENIPNNLLRELWPDHEDAILCRDGRFSAEAHYFKSKAASEGRSLIEVKKSPRSVLWRSTDNRITMANYGDAILDEHNEVLIQTTSQNQSDYRNPIRLTITSDLNEYAIAKHFLHQHVIPSPSLFDFPRLPGSLYYADLISKTTENGWSKVIGRGFKLPEIIP